MVAVSIWQVGNEVKKTTFLTNRSLKNTLWLSRLAASSLVITPPSSSHLLLWKVTAKHIKGTWYATFGTNWYIVGTTVAKQLDRFCPQSAGQNLSLFIHLVFHLCRFSKAETNGAGLNGSIVRPLGDLAAQWKRVFYVTSLHADGFISLYSSHYSTFTS